MTDRSFAAAAVLAVGLAIGGGLIGWGFARGRAADRYVEVKGLAERAVTADLALWPLRFVASGNDLATAQAQINRSYEQVLAFLKRNGIEASATHLQNLQVSDSNTNQYQRAESAGPRFVIDQTIIVRLDKPEVIRNASQRVGELIAAGVVLSQGGEYGSSGPTYVFTRLNDLKPAMIADATANARAAAEQFARDSGSAVSGIRQANQGVFVILPRDQAPGINESSQLEKTVRVVSTVQYLLD
jgi:hypothetical protein